MTGTLHENHYIHVFSTTSRSIIIRMRNVANKSFRDTQAHILCPVKFF